VDWVSQKPLKVGDKVQIRVVEADAVDEPATRNSDNRETDLEARKSHVRNLASQLGWKIQENS
jgi:protein involved in polysaccharide export with SLBB domain